MDRSERIGCFPHNTTNPIFGPRNFEKDINKWDTSLPKRCIYDNW